ncbi:MAG: DUF1365 domain-containing protein [Actinomycetota bacterium]
MTLTRAITTSPGTSAPATTRATSPATPRTIATPPGLPPLPALVDGKVTHQRRGRVRHAFGYGVYQWLVDLDALPRQPWYLRPFAGFSSSDHLGDPRRPIKDNVERYLCLNGIQLGDRGRIIMLANARVLGHVFDPLSVFWCFDDRGALVCIVAEVHNTYGERHAYLLRPDSCGSATADKAFHVSPFYDVSGRYELRFELSPHVVSSTVILRDQGSAGTAPFTATFRGTPTLATPRAVVGQLIRKPLMPQQVSAMIRVHGIFLWLRRLPVQHRPHHQPQQGI